MNEAERVLASARAKQDARARIYVPPDNAASERVFRQQKVALTRAVNSGDIDKVVIACRNAVRAWSLPPFDNAWPDDWSRWQRALDAALGFRNSVRLEDL